MAAKKEYYKFHNDIKFRGKVYPGTHYKRDRYGCPVPIKPVSLISWDEHCRRQNQDDRLKALLWALLIGAIFTLGYFNTRAEMDSTPISDEIRPEMKYKEREITKRRKSDLGLWVMDLVGY